MSKEETRRLYEKIEKNHSEVMDKISDIKDDINSMKVAEVEREKIHDTESNKKYATKNELRRVDKTLNKLITTTAGILIAIAGWGLVTLFEFMADKVQAFF